MNYPGRVTIAFVALWVACLTVLYAHQNTAFVAPPAVRTWANGLALAIPTVLAVELGKWLLNNLPPYRRHIRPGVVRVCERCLDLYRARLPDSVYKLWLQTGIMDEDAYRVFQERGVIDDDLDPEYIQQSSRNR